MTLPIISLHYTLLLVVALVLYAIIKFSIKFFRSPLRRLPCPNRTPHLLWGDVMPIMTSHGDVVHEDWMARLGSTLRFRGFLMDPWLCTRDPRAISHILMHADDFPKPESMRKSFIRVFGEGILSAEGEDHRRQRRVMNPSFNTAHLRELLPIFYYTAEQLKDILLQEAERTSDGTPVDMLMWLNRATLDIIGSAGFDYQFESLEKGEENELIRAFVDILGPSEQLSTMDIIRWLIPFGDRIPNKRTRAIDHSKRTMDRVGRSLVNAKKQAVLAAQDDFGKSSFTGRDLLSVMIKANMAKDVKDSARLSDKELIDQISTMLLAGHETSGSSLTWCLFRLSKPENQSIQSRLRDELLSVNNAQPSLEELDALPYLDGVVREILRLDAVIGGTSRSSANEAVIPVSEPYLDRDGVRRTEIHIGKDERIFIPISAMNRDRRIWGEDAEDFKPERWLNSKAGPRLEATPGVYAGTMTFMGGTRACIGYKFAVLSMKAIMFVLLRHLHFDLPENPPKIERHEAHEVTVTRPVIKQADGTLKTAMPLRVTTI